jgi:hypothetical protein
VAPAEQKGSRSFGSARTAVRSLKVSKQVKQVANEVLMTRQVRELHRRRGRTKKLDSVSPSGLGHAGGKPGGKGAGIGQTSRDLLSRVELRREGGYECVEALML